MTGLLNLITSSIVVGFIGLFFFFVRRQFQKVEERIETVDHRIDNVDKNVGDLSNRFHSLELNLVKDFARKEEVKAISDKNHLSHSRMWRAIRGIMTCMNVIATEHKNNHGGDNICLKIEMEEKD